MTRNIHMALISAIPEGYFDVINVHVQKNKLLITFGGFKMNAKNILKTRILIHCRSLYIIVTVCYLTGKACIYQMQYFWPKTPAEAYIHNEIYTPTYKFKPNFGLYIL